MKQAVAVVIQRDNQILLCRRSLQSRNQPGKWENPGGEVDGNETPEIAIIREIKEELGVDLQVNRKLYQDNFKSEDDIWQVTIFSGSIIGEPKAMISEETIEVKWFDMSKLKEVDLASYTQQDFQKFGWI